MEGAKDEETLRSGEFFCRPDMVHCSTGSLYCGASHRFSPVCQPEDPARPQSTDLCRVHVLGVAGRGALGRYQAGVYEGCMRPACAGVGSPAYRSARSTPAFDRGNRPRSDSRLQQFWERVSSASRSCAGAVRPRAHGIQSLEASSACIRSARLFFPRACRPAVSTGRTPARCRSTTRRRSETRCGTVNFDLINERKTRFAVAPSMFQRQLVYFDNDDRA